MRILVSLAVLGMLAITPAQAAEPPLRIGVLTDMSGMNAIGSGTGSVIAAKLAMEDFGPTVLGRPIEILSADHQNMPDIGAGIARGWYDRDGVSLIVDVPNSAIALAVQRLAQEKNRLAIFSTAGASDLTGKDCSANTLQWSYNTYAVAKASVESLVSQIGTKWFFLASDYAGSISMEQDAAALLHQAGGTVMGNVQAPVGAADFSSYLLQAQASGAKVLMIVTSGQDQANALKQAHEFDLERSGLHLASTFNEPYVLKSIGPVATQGFLFATSWYWNMDASARAFSARFFARANAEPSMMQAGVYSAVLNYLRAVQEAGSDAPNLVTAQLRAHPVHDMFAHDGHVRADGQMVHDMYLMRGKGAASMQGPWDVAEIIATVPADHAFLPLSQSACPLLRPKN